MKDQLTLIAKNILKRKTFTIITHISPDGDTLGAGMALYGALCNLGKQGSLVCDDNVPGSYSFLPYANAVQKPENVPAAELVIAVDCADTERMGKGYRLFESSECTVNIDHHLTNCGYAQLNSVDPHAAAVGEVIYHLVKMLGVKIDEKIATCLYVAISTDTGHFSYTNTTAQSMNIAAELMKLGANVANISRSLYRTRSLTKTRLIGKTISKMTLLAGNRICMAMITLEEMNEIGALNEDVEGVIDYLRDIDTVEIAIFIREYPDDVLKVSLRAKRTADMSELAKKFGGGGHKGAAGCTINGEKYEELYPRLLQAAIEALEG